MPWQTIEHLLRSRRVMPALMCAGLIVAVASRVAVANTLDTPVLVAQIGLPPGDVPGGIAVDPSKNRIYVTDGGSSTSPGVVWSIDATNGSSAATFSTGVTGYKAIAVNSTTHKVYVANQGTGSVTVIDPFASSTTPAMRSVAVPGCPTGIDVNPYTNRVYVSSQCFAATGDRMYVIDGSSDSLLDGFVALSAVASTVKVDPVNNNIYTHNGNSPFETIVINGNTNQVTNRVTDISAFAVNPYIPAIVGVAPNSSTGLVIDAALPLSIAPIGQAIASDLPMNANAITVDPATHGIYAFSSGSPSTMLVVSGGVPGDGSAVGETARVPLQKTVIAAAIVPEKYLYTLNSDRSVSVFALALDAITIGRVTTAGSGTVTVPVYVRDVASTPLGMDTTSRFSLPGGLCATPNGDVVVADIFNQTVRVICETVSCSQQFGVRVGGTVTLAGSPVGAYNGGRADGDNGLATAAHFVLPYGIAADPFNQDLYVADFSDRDSRIRKISASTNVITTVAGNGTAGYKGDGGLAIDAALNQPTRIAVDANRNLYIADYGNHRVRRVDHATGLITTVAGNGSTVFSGDNGPATSAGVPGPFGIAVDPAGNLFISDDVYDVIREVSSQTGLITTIAGSVGAVGSFDGTGTAARFNHPKGIAIDATGNLYVADFGNQTVREITPAGVVSTIAGTAGVAGNQDGASGRFNNPIDVSADALGGIYVSDYLNAIVRRIGRDRSVTTIAGVAQRQGTSDGAPLPRIQSFGLTLGIGDPTKIAGCANPTFPACQISFVAAGVLAGKTPSKSQLVTSSNSVSVSLQYDPAAAPLNFATNATAPGDLIGNLIFTLSSAATAGTHIQLQPDPGSTFLASSSGQSETQGTGTLGLTAGEIDVTNTTAVPVVTSFSASPPAITAGQPATLTWSTSNATTVTIDPAIGTVAANGSLTVFPLATTTYTITASAPGATATATTTVTVNPACPAMVPQGNVFVSYHGSTSGCTVSQPTCTSGEAIAFSVSTAGYDFSCSPHTFSWDFGDGSHASDSSPAPHAYANPGRYTVTLTISNGTQTAVLQTTVIVVTFPFDFTISPLAGVANGYVFTAISRGTATTPSYDWDFGDGSTSATPAPTTSHIFADSRKYTVTLTAPDFPGGKVQHSVPLNVKRRSVHP